jgi:hypothetical protein
MKLNNQILHTQLPVHSEPDPNNTGIPTPGKPRRRWEDNIKMNFQEVGWGAKDWIDLAQDTENVAGTCKGCSEPWCSIKYGEFLH